MRCRSRRRTGCGRRTGRRRRRRPGSGRRRRARRRRCPSGGAACLTAVVSSALIFFSLASTATRSASSSAAIRRRVLPSQVAGPHRRPAVALACNADRSRLAPPGISSLSSRCSRLTVCTRSRDSSSRRSVSMPQRLQITRRARPPAARGPQATTAIAVRIAGVGLAVVPGVERPAPGRPAWPARRPPLARPRPAAAPTADRHRWLPRPPTPAAATPVRTGASPRSRPCRW